MRNILPSINFQIYSTLNLILLTIKYILNTSFVRMIEIFLEQFFFYHITLPDLRAVVDQQRRNSGQFVVKSLVLIISIVIPVGWNSQALFSCIAISLLQLRRLVIVISHPLLLWGDEGVRVTPLRQYTANTVDKINAYMHAHRVYTRIAPTHVKPAGSHTRFYTKLKPDNYINKAYTQACFMYIKYSITVGQCTLVYRRGS